MRLEMILSSHAIHMDSEELRASFCLFVSQIHDIPGLEMSDVCYLQSVLINSRRVPEGGHQW